MRRVVFLHIAMMAGLGASPLPQRAYIWQRQWSAALRTAVAQHAHQFAGIDVLCAEVSYTGQNESWIETAPDLPLLAQTHVPVGIVLRVGTLPNGGARRAAEANIILHCQAQLKQARRSEFQELELQLDCDVPTRLLPEYGQFLAQLQQSILPIPLYFTALPSWLESASFQNAASAARGYILQVHSLQRPGPLGQAVTLCDPQLAVAWMGQASRLGINFRVALPTYGYRIAYDSAGNFLALQADGAPSPRANGTQVRTILANPSELAGVMTQLVRNTPRYCQGVEWFRFPVAEQDTLAWRWETLEAVMDGVVPVAAVALQTTSSRRGLYELYIANSGAAPARPNDLLVHWGQARFLAADGIGDWQIKFKGGHNVRVEYPGADRPLLQPGEKQQVGWLRLDRPEVLQGEAPSTQE